MNSSDSVANAAFANLLSASSSNLAFSNLVSSASSSSSTPASLYSSGSGTASGGGVLTASSISFGNPPGSSASSSSSLTGIHTNPTNVSTAASTAAALTGSIDELLPLVLQLEKPEQREVVLLELSKKRENFADLAPILWHTIGTIAALLQEIVSIYPYLSPPTLTAHASNRVCNALALLQCVASHADTRSLFLQAHIPLYLYPFLNTQSKSRPFEYLRLTSLGVIGALVKIDDADVINFLLQTEIIPLCLRIMETGSELSKTVATFIVQKILLDEIGLSYVCATAERFYAISTVLNNMVSLLVQSPSVRLLKHIVRCYLRLSDNLRAREALRQCLPVTLRDETFAMVLRDDVTVKKWLSQLLTVVGSPSSSNVASGSSGNTAGLSLSSSSMAVPTSSSSSTSASSNPGVPSSLNVNLLGLSSTVVGNSSTVSNPSSSMMMTDVNVLSSFLTSGVSSHTTSSSHTFSFGNSSSTGGGNL